MSNQQQSHRQHQQHQQHQPNDHRETLDRQRPGNPLEHRREFLWRERVKLEMQVQALLALLQSLEQEWCVLQHRKASMEQEKPKLAAQIVLSGLTGTRSLQTERLFQYRRERLIQEEERLGQTMFRYQHDLAGFMDKSRSSFLSYLSSASAMERHGYRDRGVLCRLLPYFLFLPHPNGMLSL